MIECTSPKFKGYLVILILFFESGANYTEGSFAPNNL